MKYSVAEGRSIKEVNPKIKDKVHVKDSSGTFEGVIDSSGMTVSSTLVQNNVAYSLPSIIIFGGDSQRKIVFLIYIYCDCDNLHLHRNYSN